MSTANQVQPPLSSSSSSESSVKQHSADESASAITGNASKASHRRARSAMRQPNPGYGAAMYRLLKECDPKTSISHGFHVGITKAILALQTRILATSNEMRASARRNKITARDVKAAIRLLMPSATANGMYTGASASSARGVADPTRWAKEHDSAVELSYVSILADIDETLGEHAELNAAARERRHAEAADAKSDKAPVRRNKLGLSFRPSIIRAAATSLGLNMVKEGAIAVSVFLASICTELYTQTLAHARGVKSDIKRAQGKHVAHVIHSVPTLGALFGGLIDVFPCYAYPLARSARVDEAAGAEDLPSDD